MKTTNNKANQNSKPLLFKALQSFVTHSTPLSFGEGLGVRLLLTLIVAISFSCRHIYDNVEEYAPGVIIYADKLDGIINVHVGYERVEIDLMKAGRIPSSMIRMGKAKKTVIECEDFTEPGNRRVFDSVCSWVNITGLTQLKDYHITIYTEDEHGNRSIPLKTAVRPYTAENLNTIEIVAPSIIESTEAVMLEWKGTISAQTHTVYRYAYSYPDRDGVPRTGKDDGDVPVILLENIEKGKDVTLTLTCRMIPALSNFDGTYTPILDTLDWQMTFNLRISENADPVIFLKTPAPTFVIDRENEETFPFTFSWLKVSEVTGYSLKISTRSNFPNDNSTYTLNLGDVDEYTINAGMIDAIKALPLANERENQLYWTVMPMGQSVTVKNQIRPFTFLMFEKVHIIPLAWSGTRLQCTATEVDDYIIVTATNNDPSIATSTLGVRLRGLYYLAIEYKSDMVSTEGQIFYCVSGTAQGGVSTPTNLQFPQASDWSWFRLDLATAMDVHGWGVDNRGGREPELHFFRFDFTQNNIGYITFLRTVQLEGFHFD